MRFGLPLDLNRLVFLAAGLDLNSILDVFSEDTCGAVSISSSFVRTQSNGARQPTVCVNGQAVLASLDARDRGCSIARHVAPVLEDLGIDGVL